MRTKFTLFLTVLTFGVFAQSPLKLIQPTDLTTDVNNTTITVNGQATDPDMEAILWVVNQSGATLDIKCKKTEVDVLANTENTTCWKLCPTTYDVAGSKPVVIVNISGTQMVETAADGDTIKSFVGHYKPQSLDGCSLFKYEWYDSNDLNTALATVFVRFVHTTGACTASVNEVPKLEVSMYPNPANTELRLSLAELPNTTTTVEFIDVLGKKVHQQRIGSQTSTVDVSNLPEGIYFARFVIDGNVVNTKKFIVKR